MLNHSRTVKLWLVWSVVSAGSGLLTGYLLPEAKIHLGFVFGLCFSVPQWLILRNYILNSSLWIAVTLTGCIFAWGIAVIIATLLSGILTELLPGPSGAVLGIILVAAPWGATLGFFQALLLSTSHRVGDSSAGWRRRRVGTILTWTFASGLGWGLFWIVKSLATPGGLTAHAVLARDPVAGCLGGAVYGVISGLALVSLAVDQG